ncbi:MAG: Gfo/Idh/MocA family oxidoreductase [Arachnia sp.]
MSAPLSFGVLGAAGITPTALIDPARENPDVEVLAVAARDRARAEEFAAQHKIARVHDTYEDLLADPEVEAVYIPLPNSEHGRWTIAALEAGKHVLVEKPFTSNADEARAVAARAAESDRVVMEAFHYRYHALTEEILRLIREGAIGDLVNVDAWFYIHLTDRTNIRYIQELAGGATMDLGCYALHLVRSVVGEEPEMLSGTARPSTDPRLDEALSVQVRFPSGVTGTIASSLLEDEGGAGATITGTRGVLQVDGYVAPQNGCSLTLTVDGETTDIPVPELPSSYARQLEVFVAAVRDGAPLLTGPEDSVATMTAIDAMYRAAGLQPRD